ncbi:MAG: type I methionyl aminopeptidase [Patescibacteria group bacterium]|nr:type I methionyl aminopeptidase [Patescibacteria group bacterium]
MKVTKKSKKEIAILRQGGKILAEALVVASNFASLANEKKVTTKDLDRIAEEVVRGHGAEPAFLNYQPEGYENPFPAALCTSVNDEIVHGFPNENVVLKNGDVVSLDLGVKFKGLFTDSAVTVAIGKVDEQTQRLIDVTKKGLENGIKQLVPGNTLGDYGKEVDGYAHENGFVTVWGLVGHGVGYSQHEDPQIPNYGKAGKGLVIEEGMVLALEPMFTLKSRDIVMDSNGYTFSTSDGEMAAHFEHTVAITKKGNQVLTRAEE